MYCICCGKEISLLVQSPNDDIHCDPESVHWNNGVVQKISAGYGSSLDGDVYLIAICDKCLEQKNKEGSAIFIYDYMSNHNIEERRKEKNKVLHRRNKLRRISK